MNFRNPTLRFTVSVALLAGVSLLAAPGPKPAPKPGPKPAAAEPIITQAEMNEQAGEGLAQADAELNRVYRTLLDGLKGRPADAERLRRAQRAWVAFRDAHVEAFYPAAEVGAGSFRPVCVAAVRQQLTEARTRQLQSLLTAPPEGELCAPRPTIGTQAPPGPAAPGRAESRR